MLRWCCAGVSDATQRELFVKLYKFGSFCGAGYIAPYRARHIFSHWFEPLTLPLSLWTIHVRSGYV